MSYINADIVLPKELIKEIQKYVNGVNLYIPKVPEAKRACSSSRRSVSIPLHKDIGCPRLRRSPGALRRNGGCPGRMRKRMETEEGYGSWFIYRKDD